MAYKLNPNYNPNDPNSMRYIQIPDAPMSTVTPNMSVLPTAPAPNQSKLNYSPAPATPAPAPTPKLDPNLTALNPNPTTATNTQSTTPKVLTQPKAPTNPYASITPPAPTEQSPNQPAPVYNLSPSGGGYLPTIDAAQRQSIDNLVASGRPFNETDARNYAYATGQTDYNQFVGKTGAQITGVGLQGGQANPNQNTTDTTPNPDNPGGMSDQELAAAAGRAGLSVDDYIALVQARNPQGQSETDAIRNRLGIPGLIDEVYKKPAQTTVDAYNEFYKLSGLDEVKNKVSALDEQIAQRRRDLVTATGELQNNPWLSQATRTGRLRILNELANADINNLTEQRKQYMDQYNNGVSKVEDYVKRVVYDRGQEQNLNVDKLNYLLNEAERQDKAAQSASKAKALRYVPDYLQSKADNSSQFNSGSIQEYRYYEQQERKAGRVPMSYNDYQTMDANRKARAAGGGPASLLTPEQYADAARKGYVSDQQLTLYASIVANGQTAPNIKAPTESQGQALGFFDRTRSSNDTISKLENQFTGILAQGGKLPNFLKSADRQVFDQAERNFINATLRRESGATIQPDEFAVARQQYIPQPGDTAAVLEAKRQNRASIINSLRVQAGNFADDLPQQKMTLQTFYQSNPDKQATIDKLIQAGKTDAEIETILGIGSGFNPPPSTGKKGSLTVAPGNRNPSKVIGGYDFTNYATDPKWGNGVNTILSRMPAINNASDVSAYIAAKAPKSPLVKEADNIIKIARTQQIDPRLLLAIMEQESRFGTLGRAAYTFNPANVGNVDSGANRNWGSWSGGVQALANNINKRVIA